MPSSTENMAVLIAQSLTPVTGELPYDFFPEPNSTSPMLDWTSNTSSETYGVPDVAPRSLAELIGVSVVTGAASIITVIGNILVIAAFCTDTRLQKLSNYFLLSLAAADMIVGAFSMPLYTMYLMLGSWPLGAVSCDLWLTLDYSCCAASILNILVISIDRYWSVTSTVTYRNRMNKRLALLFIAPTWIVPIIAFSAVILFWPYFTSLRDEGLCYAQYSDTPAGAILVAVATYWLPLAIILFIYHRIYTVAKRLKMRTKVAVSSTQISLASSTSQDKLLSARQSRVSSPTDPRPPLHPRDEVESSFFSDETKGSNSSGDSGVQQAGSSNSSDPNKISLTANDVVEESKGSDEKTPSPKKVVKPKKTTNNDGQKEPKSQKGNHISKRPAHKPPKSKNFKKNAGKSSANTLWEKCKDQRKPTVGFTGPSHRHGTRDKKAMRTLTVVLGAFILCWTPFSILIIINSITKVSDRLFEISYWLCYVNSSLNPFCYAYANIHFRESFIRLLTCNTMKRGARY